jgi:nitroimidazol reductase NimA-like FMN-containing flavoprotein (pyridoxamine 5'-phosphate oxidase superfamily)
LKKTRRTIPDKVTKGNVSVIERLFSIDISQPHAVLATESNGQPYTSLVAYALSPDARGIVFTTPKSTRKHRNILKNKKVSLLIDTRTNTERDYLNAESVTILGKAYPVRKGKKWIALSRILLKKHPRLADIMDSPETTLVLIRITTCIHVSQFQSVTVWNVKSE